MENDGTRHEWRDDCLGLARVVRCRRVRTKGEVEAQRARMNEEAERLRKEVERLRQAKKAKGKKGIRKQAKGKNTEGAEPDDLPGWLAVLAWQDDFRPIDDSPEAVGEWVEHALLRVKTNAMDANGETLAGREICCAAAVSLVRDAWLLADHLRHNGWRQLPRQPKDGELGIAGAIRALHKLRKRIADGLTAKTTTAADAPLGAEQGEVAGTGVPYRCPVNYERDKWIYENIGKYTCHALSRKLRGIVKTKKWILISSRNGFKNAADRYADFHRFEQRRFPGE